MKVAIIYNKDVEGVINTFGMQNKEFYNEKTVHKVASSLEKAGHNVAILDGNKQIIERLENFMPRVMEGEQMGMVFNMAYGIQGESRYTHIPSMLEMLGLPYVGSSPSGHALALDKVLTKIIWKNNQLPTPDFWVFNSASDDMSGVKFPVIVKPKMESVSFGLKVVYTIPELKEAVAFIIQEFDQQALVEQFIRGREFAVGILGNGAAEIFPVLEIDLEGNPDAIQTADNKKLTPKNKICPAPLPDELAKQMQEISLQAFHALNLRDFSRVDIRLDEDNNIYLLEINSMASLGETGSYPTAARVAGYNFERLVNKMLDVASVRYFANSLSPQSLPQNGKSALSQATRMRTFIKSRQDQTERFLQQLTDTNTHVRNVEGVNHNAMLISRELGQLGFSHEIYAQQEVGNLMFLRNTINEQLDTLILLPVDNGIKLAQQEYFTRDEQHLEGSGIWTHKGGAAILLSALQALRFTRSLKKQKLGILLITDTTIDGRYSRKIIHQKALLAQKVIALSGASQKGGLILSRSGSARYHLELKLVNTQQAAHVSEASQQFHKFVAALCDIAKPGDETVIAPFDSQFKSNIFKKQAHGSAGISVRFHALSDLEAIEQKIQRLVKAQKKNKNFKLHLEGGLKRPPMPQNEANEAFFSGVEELTKTLSIRVSKEHRWSSSDICHVPDTIARLDGLGPVGEILPSDKEQISRHSLIERSLLLALLLQKIS